MGRRAYPRSGLAEEASRAVAQLWWVLFLGGPGVEVTLYLLDATVLDCIYCNTFFKGTTVNRAPNLMLLGFSRH